MRNSRLALATLSAAVLALSPIGFSHAEDMDENNLVQEQGKIDGQTTPDTGRSALLAKQFGVEEARVNSLRQSGKGWGALTTELAMAQELMKKDPTTYPTMDAALEKVGMLRAEGKGYGAIAKELGFKLGPVISAAKHTRNEMRREARTEEMQAMKIDHPSPTDKPEKMSRPERAAKMDRPDRPAKGPKH